MNKNKLSAIFKIVSFLDAIRWHSSKNYSIINFYKKDSDLSPDTKILTHWLCYITDRQMAFERVWDIGGYVFSELVDVIKKDKDLELLNPDNPKAFIKKNNNGGYFFASQSIANDESILNRLKRYDEFNTSDNAPGYVKFSSRYYPSDYFSILYTLFFLKEYDFTFSKFIKEVYEGYGQDDDFIKKLLFSMYLLTYYNIGQPKYTNITFSKNINDAERRTKRLQKLFRDRDRFNKEYATFSDANISDANIFRQKRAWCSLRDFIKSPEFKGYFKNALSEVGISDFSVFESDNTLKNLELPGDVWNNNSRFRQCILSETEYDNEKESKKRLNKILREFFDKNGANVGGGYPEQFDITFDFVPRMCEKNNCDICPVGKIGDGQGKDFDKICINDKSKFCSVAMITCNYKINCYGDNCELYKLIMHPGSVQHQGSQIVE